jgi:uncharacterized protein (TIGR02646 family)
MIRIRRGPEPAKLLPIRSKKLSDADVQARAGTLKRDHIAGYDVVKDDLWRAQHFKCCYCERNNLEASHSDVEHYRPAIRADRGEGFPSHGYWWLAWTWANLMFACKVCNGSAKGARFPLDGTSVPLEAHQKPPGGEFPLLIDPCAEDPIKHILFRPMVTDGRHRWFPFARSGSHKGHTTISVLKLDRPQLLDLYDHHVDHHVSPVVKRLSAAIEGGNATRVQEIWKDDILVLIERDRPFTALSYDAIDHFVPVGVRRSWRLSLRRPR